jgi:flavin reductase (DIM6/NTAB) family NADH-FMN oxidoreductase RutF
MVSIAYFRSSLKTRQLISKFLFGLTIPQQYICLSAEDFSDGLEITLSSREDAPGRSVNPIFVGYKPVVFALSEIYPKVGNEFCLTFHSRGKFRANSTWKGFSSDANAVARMVVKLLPVNFKSLKNLNLLQGVVSDHEFMSRLHQYLNSFRDKFRSNKPGNVDLPGNQHDMVRIAYSLPRTIALVSVSDGVRMNLFPTDLHGQINDDFYISSLRVGGQAERQVQEFRKIVLCEVGIESFRGVYSLGKNHMKEMSLPLDFELSSSFSEKFRFPLPKTVLRYFELTVEEFVDVGIHRIFLYRIENMVILQKGKTLSHIHQYYAEWRKRNGLKTEMLLR